MQWQWRGALHSPKLQHHLNLTIRLFSVISWTHIEGGRSYPSAEKQSVYSTAPADLASLDLVFTSYIKVWFSIWNSYLYMLYYIYIYIYIYHQVVLISRIDSFSPSISIIHHSWQVLKTAYTVHSQLIRFCWSANTGLSHVWEPARDRHRWVCHCFSSNAQHVSLGWPIRWETSNHTATFLWDAVSRISWKQYAVFHLQFLSSFFSKRFRVVQLYNGSDTATALWEFSFYFIIEIKFPYGL